MTSRRSTAPPSAPASPRESHERRHPGQRAGQAVPEDLGAARLHAGHPRGPRRRARRPQRRGQDHPAAAGHRDAHADPRHDHRPRPAPRGGAGAAGPGRLRRPGHPHLLPDDGRRPSPARRLAQPRLGRPPGAAADQSARPEPEATRRVAVRRAARPARPPPGAGQAARTAHPRRAGRQPGPAGPAGIPAGPDGSGRRAAPQRPVVLPSGRRPGTGLRLPGHSRRLPGPGRRGGQRPAGLASPPVRAAPRPWHLAGGPGNHHRKPHRQAEQPAGPDGRAGPRPGLGREAGQPGGPGAGLHEPGRRRQAGQPATTQGGLMIRLSMLQLRVQAITAAVALIAFAVLLAATGPHLASLYAASGLRGCQPASCGQRASSFLPIVLTPAVIGLFWGAPLLARELETGTFALAWSQSVTRARWLAVKLTVGGLAAIFVTEALSLLFAWWAAPLGRAAGLGGSGNSLAMNQFNPLAFVPHGITPLGYAAFAFTLGVTAGALIRRTVPAMAVTLAIFAAVQIAMPLWIRPNLFPASHAVVSVSSETTLNLYRTDSAHTFTFTLATDGLTGQPGAWIRSSGAADAAGHLVSTVVPSACSPAASRSGPGPALANCLASRGLRIAVTYQPASRDWPLQWTETGIYLVLSLALAGSCFRRLSRLS